MTDICNMYTDLKNKHHVMHLMKEKQFSEWKKLSHIFTNWFIHSQFLSAAPIFHNKNSLNLSHWYLKSEQLQQLFKKRAFIHLGESYIHDQCRFSLRAKLTSFMFFKTHCKLLFAFLFAGLSSLAHPTITILI